MAIRLWELWGYPSLKDAAGCTERITQNYIKEKAKLAWSITYLNEWKHFCWISAFASTSLSHSFSVCIFVF